MSGNAYGADISIADVKITNSNINATHSIKNLHINTLGRAIYSIDVTELQGEHYVNVFTQGNSECKGEYYGVWLEK